MINLFKNKCLSIAALTTLNFLLILPVSNAKTYQFGAWRVKVTHDRFSDVEYCRIYGKSMTTKDGIVSLNFQHNIDTDEAWYRIDNGPAARLTDLQTRVNELAVFPERGPVENPSNGQAKFPAELLLQSKAVDIRTPHPGWVKHFRTDGLEQALGFANDRNCSLSAPG